MLICCSMYVSYPWIRTYIMALQRWYKYISYKKKHKYEYKYKHWAHAYFLDVVGPMSYQSGADKLSMLKWR